MLVRERESFYFTASPSAFYLQAGTATDQTAKVHTVTCNQLSVNSNM